MGSKPDQVRSSQPTTYPGTSNNRTNTLRDSKLLSLVAGLTRVSLVTKINPRLYIVTFVLALNPINAGTGP